MADLFSKPDIPTPPPPPPAPNPNDANTAASMQAAAQAQRQKAQFGRASTLLTGPQGLDQSAYKSSTASQTLLGS